MAEFCAGPEAYVWWQAGPWSGKSALASWFVTHPPVGVDVVSFFITGRLAGQADSDAFLDAMIDQLNALGPAGGSLHPWPGHESAYGCACWQTQPLRRKNGHVGWWSS